MQEGSHLGVSSACEHCAGKTVACGSVLHWGLENGNSLHIFKGMLHSFCNPSFIWLRQKNGKFKASQSLYEGDTLSEKQKQSKKPNEIKTLIYTKFKPHQNKTIMEITCGLFVLFLLKEWFGPALRSRLFGSSEECSSRHDIGVYRFMGLAFWLSALAPSQQWEDQTPVSWVAFELHMSLRPSMALVETYAILICKVSLKNIPWNQGYFPLKKTLYFKWKTVMFLKKRWGKWEGLFRPQASAQQNCPEELLPRHLDCEHPVLAVSGRRWHCPPGFHFLSFINFIIYWDLFIPENKSLVPF